MSETIEIQGQAQSVQWIPSVGEETLGLLRSKGFADAQGNLSESGQRILEEALGIMQLCGNPRAHENNETGIVIGYVQSGKTLSFTTLTALACDNGYQIVIVIGGTSVNLLDQSTNRLINDLRISSRYGFEQKWTLIRNASTQEDISAIRNALRQWADPTYPKDRCRTVLVAVMKHKDHLRNLTELLRGFSLINVPTLIIDDEGDQASLNTFARRASRRGADIENLSENDVSTIYRRITTLKGIFPHHTFIQYTATPQANLFINILDRLSPNFIKLLTPGEEYTGGAEFFQENLFSLIREIPANEIPGVSRQLPEPPDSLLNALRIFFLGVVAGIALEHFRRPGQRNRSMLIHPSRLQADHTTFYHWVSNICGSWRRLLSGNDEEERAALLEEFLAAYNDLRGSVGGDLPSFERLTGNELIHAITYTPIVEVNTRDNRDTPQIRWQDSYSWILVGGQSMDRGFTVEGLTVTYMPRNVGVGNVDTIQQRARFFGYKRSYLDYCRVFLDQVTIDAYRAIVDHEEDVRSRLEEFNVNNRHLNEWAREVVLDQMLNLTRANILFDPLERDRFGDDWVRIKAPHDTEDYIAANRNALFEYLIPRANLFLEDQGHQRRTQEQRHLVARIALRDVLESLLNKLRFTRESDSATYSSLRGILMRHLNGSPSEDALIYLMSTSDISIDGWNARVRRLNAEDEIQQLFQGRNPKTGNIIYPGDSEIKDDQLVTIQVHLLNIRDTNYTNVPTLAIWIPERIGKDIIRQA